ncbi:MAG: hypothetical protein AB1671_13665 [Thermodesulfobacteriota bacterium]|jgi:hypothetical protein
MRQVVTPVCRLRGRALTDRILALCASGSFGVREAIAVATAAAVRKVPQSRNPRKASRDPRYAHARR